MWHHVKQWWDDTHLFIIFFLGFVQTRFFTLVSEDQNNFITVFRYNPTKNWFILNPMSFPLRTHIYFISQHLHFMTIFWFIQRLLIWVVTKLNHASNSEIISFLGKLAKMFAIGFALEFVDLLDYFINYNDPYTLFLRYWPVEYNDFKLIFWGITIYITWKSKQNLSLAH